MTKRFSLLCGALIILLVIGGGCAMSDEVDSVAEKAEAEKVIKNSIRWVLNKDKDLSYSCFAMDSSLFWFSPDNAGTISGSEAFKTLTEQVFMNPAFKGVRSEFKDLRITLSRSGDCAWWSCYLDDFNEWNGQPANWVNVRWTGVLEKIDGQWKIRQMHFSHALEDFQKKSEPSGSAGTQK
jgi:ketosteroid isomerase-like protein